MGAHSTHEATTVTPERTRNVILLVDDNQTHVYALKRHLTGSGFEVLHAHSAAAAVEVAFAQRPDVVLLDINLPDATGFDVCQQLKADPRTRAIPIVFHSATHDTASARSQAADLGAVSFLSYPINVEHLENVIKGAIAHARKAAEPA
jgi:CheY-like chemotaxis protein